MLLREAVQEVRRSLVLSSFDWTLGYLADDILRLMREYNIDVALLVSPLSGKTAYVIPVLNLIIRHSAHVNFPPGETPIHTKMYVVYYPEP
jgi:hypothetical protein